MARPENHGTLIKEIILENFMSYEYARIPFEPGLNIICGPNGSGKSSILLALAVALGQTYTERSRKLSDLIRRGKDMGRVSVVFDNSSRNGHRPIPSCRADAFVLSRYLKQDGTYWHEANYRTVTKGEVLRTLSRLVINPDNMLIIMHQNMIDVFGAINVQERLKMLEEAVGLREYREQILEAREKLSHTLSEEESIKSLLERGTETLKYWKGEYQRYLRKKELTERKENLELEYAWAKWANQKRAVDGTLAKIENSKGDLKEIEQDLEKIGNNETQSRESLKRLEYDQESTYQELVTHERARGGAETKLEVAQSVAEALQPSEGKTHLQDILERLKSDIRDAKRELKELGGKVEETKSALVKTKEQHSKEHEKYVNLRVRSAILDFRREMVEKEISSLKSELRRAKLELEELQKDAKQVGIKVKTERKPREVLDEIRVVNAQLAGLEDVSPDVERMYRSYRDLLKELKQKVEIAAANRKKALGELETRKGKWSEGLRKLLRKVRETYKEALKRANATGDVRITNLHDIDEAGLELVVGFRGAEPMALDAYTQSGGERTTSIMCFLLALQQHIKSPIRAIDEFDIHMDPRNRETMMKQLLSLMEEEDAQYIVITPGRLVEIEEVPNVITVQNVAGSSKVKVAA
jgi:chromosome segregation protein